MISEEAMFVFRTIDLAEEMFKLFGPKIDEYSRDAASNWPIENKRKSMATIASAMAVGMIGGNIIRTVREEIGEESAAVVKRAIEDALSYRSWSEGESANKQ